MKDDTETNIAATLRDITANCDKTTGKILRLCSKAAHKGEEYVIVKVEADIRSWVANRSVTARPIPILIEKLESLGFKISAEDKMTWFSGLRCYIRISW